VWRRPESLTRRLYCRRGARQNGAVYLRLAAAIRVLLAISGAIVAGSAERQAAAVCGGLNALTGSFSCGAPKTASPASRLVRR